MPLLPPPLYKRRHKIVAALTHVDVQLMGAFPRGRAQLSLVFASLLVFLLFSSSPLKPLRSSRAELPILRDSSGNFFAPNSSRTIARIMSKSGVERSRNANCDTISIKSLY